MLDAVRRPYGIDTAIGYGRQIRKISEYVRLYRRIEIHAQLPPAVEVGGQGAGIARTAADINQHALPLRPAHGRRVGSRPGGRGAPLTLRAGASRLRSFVS